MKELTRDQKLDIIGKNLYERWMSDSGLLEEELAEYPWEGASSETEREAKEYARSILAALEEAEGRIPKDRPPVPRPVFNLLDPVMTPSGIDKWWTGYLRMDPLAQEGFATEAARYFVNTLDSGGSARFR